jgi:hypothetical protein
MLSAKDFVAIHGGTINSVYQAHKNNNKYISKDGKYLIVDDKSLLKRRQFQVKIKLQNQGNYYELKALGVSDTDLSNILAAETDRAAHTWRMYMSTSLFSLAYDDKNLLAYKVNKMDCQFNKITRRLLR